MAFVGCKNPRRREWHEHRGASRVRLLAAFVSVRREFIGRPDEVKKVLPDTCTFVTSASELQWLTRAIFVGTGERHPTEVVIRMWKVD